MIKTVRELHRDLSAYIVMGMGDDPVFLGVNHDYEELHITDPADGLTGVYILDKESYGGWNDSE